MEQPLIESRPSTAGRRTKYVIGALVGLAVCGVAGAAVYSTAAVPPTHQMMLTNAVDSYSTVNLLLGDGPSWKPCGGNSGSTGVTITNIQMNPYPIQRGSPFSIVTTGHADAAHERVSAKVTVKVAGISVYSKTLPIQGGLAAGDFSHDSSKDGGDSQSIPKIAPAGTYGVELEIVDDDHNGSQLSCVDISFKVA